MRTVSAPKRATTSSGSITLPRDLLIFWPSGPRMSERFMRRVYGSFSATSPRSKSALCQKRLYKTCIVVCSAPPEYRSIGIQFAIFLASANFFLFLGSAYRKKYHDESTNVSSVSVSRSAFPLHFGHFTCTHFFAFARGDLPRPSGR